MATAGELSRGTTRTTGDTPPQLLLEAATAVLTAATTEGGGWGHVRATTAVIPPGPGCDVVLQVAAVGAGSVAAA